MTIDQIMQQDEQIDELPEIAIMDLYNREKLMKAMMERYGSKYNGFSDPDFKEAENVLNRMNHEGVRVWSANASRKGILSEGIGRLVSDNRSEDFTISLFNYMTNDDMEQSRKIEIVKDYLKNLLQGSIGMPNDRVVRERMKDYDF